MWLPIDVCQAFEKAFNLTWNASAELYLLSENQHTALLAQNPTFTFSIGSSADVGQTADITFPYAAFDLRAVPPFVETETWYFPLKRAQNSSQYTLGRVFLQEAYVIADYDRRNFSVSQALVPNRDTVSNIVAIEALKTTFQSEGSSHLSTGTIAGIAVGGVIALILVLGVVFWLRRLFCSTARKHEPKMMPPSRNSEGSSQLHHAVEMNALDGGIYEPDSRRAFPPELHGYGMQYSPKVYELRDRRSVFLELDASNSR